MEELKARSSTEARVLPGDHPQAGQRGAILGNFLPPQFPGCAYTGRPPHLPYIERSLFWPSDGSLNTI
jgi:hypothetical protein